MAIRLCSNNHVTGYRTCPQCGEPAAPTRVRAVDAVRAAISGQPQATVIPAPRPKRNILLRVWRRLHTLKHRHA